MPTFLVPQLADLYLKDYLIRTRLIAQIIVSTSSLLLPAADARFTHEALGSIYVDPS